MQTDTDRSYAMAEAMDKRISFSVAPGRETVVAIVVVTGFSTPRTTTSQEKPRLPARQRAVDRRVMID